MNKPNDKTENFARQPWEPAGVISPDETVRKTKGKKAPEKGGMLGLDVENAFHNKGLMEGQLEQNP